MSHNEHETHHGLAPQANLSKLGSAGTLVGLLLLLIYLVLIFMAPSAPANADFREVLASPRSQLLQSYAFGFVCFASISLGLLGLTLLHHSVRGSWGLSVLRLAEAGASARTFVLLGILYLPLVIFARDLYPWADPARVARDQVLLHKAVWMNIGMVTFRAYFMFAIWGFMARFLRISSIRQDESKDEAEAQKRTNWATPWIVLWVLTVTCMSTDWVMSIDAHWYSTMFGPMFVVGSPLGALALTCLLLGLNGDKEPYATIAKPNVTRDLGNMLLTCTMLWAYFNFSQFLIIWNGNLPPVTEYYFHRSVQGWNFVGFLLIVFQFFVPFTLLLSPKMKASPKNLAVVAAIILVMRVVDMHYMIAPMYRTNGAVPHWQDLMTFAAVGGLWVANFCYGVAKAPLYPAHDMRLMEATEHA